MARDGIEYGLAQATGVGQIDPVQRARGQDAKHLQVKAQSRQRAPDVARPRVLVEAVVEQAQIVQLRSQAR